MYNNVNKGTWNLDILSYYAVWESLKRWNPEINMITLIDLSKTAFAFETHAKEPTKSHRIRIGFNVKFPCEIFCAMVLQNTCYTIICIVRI